jgi:flagellin-like hook-associated protein FlgL
MYGDTGEIDWDSMDPDGVYHDPRTGELISLNRNNFLGADGEVTVLYDREGFSRNELNPTVFMTCTIPAQPGPPPVPAQTLNMNNQQMEFEFSVNTRIPINVLAKDAFNPIMFADILGIANDILAMSPTTHAELISRGMTDQEERDEFLRREAMMMETSSNDMLNRLIGRMEGYLTQVSRVEANLGSRMTRVDSIGERLEADAVIFEELSTENIGVDLPSVSMRFAMAEVALMASLQVGMSHVLNLSLLNFL